MKRNLSAAKGERKNSKNEVGSACWVEAAGTCAGMRAWVRQCALSHSIPSSLFLVNFYSFTLYFVNSMPMKIPMEFIILFYFSVEASASSIAQELPHICVHVYRLSSAWSGSRRSFNLFVIEINDEEEIFCAHLFQCFVISIPFWQLALTKRSYSCYCVGLWTTHFSNQKYDVATPTVFSISF